MGLFDFLKEEKNTASKDFSMVVEDTFSIKGRGVVVCGDVLLGEVNVGDEVSINNKSYLVGGIENNKQIIKKATVNMSIGLLLKGADINDIKRGDVVQTF